MKPQGHYLVKFNKDLTASGYYSHSPVVHKKYEWCKISDVVVDELLKHGEASECIEYAAMGRGQIVNISLKNDVIQIIRIDYEPTTNVIYGSI